jgi:hypothetical protein
MAMAEGKSSPCPFTRALNRSGRAIERAGIPLVRIERDALLADARSRARLDDFGDDTFREPSARLIDRRAERSSA